MRAGPPRLAAQTLSRRRVRRHTDRRELWPHAETCYAAPRLRGSHPAQCGGAPSIKSEKTISKVWSIHVRHEAHLMRHEVLSLLIHSNLQRLKTVLPWLGQAPCRAPGLAPPCLQPCSAPCRHISSAPSRKGTMLPTCPKQLLCTLLKALCELSQLRVLRQSVALQQHRAAGAALCDGVLCGCCRIACTHCRCLQLSCAQHGTYRPQYV